MGEEVEGYLSDESSFYGNHTSSIRSFSETSNTSFLEGDDNVKASLEERVEAFDVEESWTQKQTSPSMEEIAEENIAKAMALEKSKKTVQLYNPYQGIRSARQLEETVDKFLERMPPATTIVSDVLHWIWIANPFVPITRFKKELHVEYDLPDQADGPDWDQFKLLGDNLLEELKDDIETTAKDLAGKVSSKLPLP